MGCRIEQSLGDPRFSLEVAYFTRRVKGLIEGVLVDPANFIFQAQNKGRVDVQGVRSDSHLPPLVKDDLERRFRLSRF